MKTIKSFYSLSSWTIVIVTIFSSLRANSCIVNYVFAVPSSIIVGDSATIKILTGGGCTNFTLNGVPITDTVIVVHPIITTNYIVSYTENGTTHYKTCSVIVNPPLTTPLVEAGLDTTTASTTDLCVDSTRDTILSFYVQNVATSPIHITKIYVSNVGTAGIGSMKNISVSETLAVAPSTDTLPRAFILNGFYIKLGWTKKLDVSCLITTAAIGKTIQLQIDSFDVVGGIAEYKQTFRVPITGNKMTVIDCSHNGINEYSDKNLFSIYPNPATNELHIQTSSAEEIRIYNSIGEKVWEGLDHNIDISYLPTGFYFLIMGGETKQFIKL